MTRESIVTQALEESNRILVGERDEAREAARESRHFGLMLQRRHSRALIIAHIAFAICLPLTFFATLAFVYYSGL